MVGSGLNLKGLILAILLSIPYLGTCCLNCDVISSDNCIQCSAGYYLFDFICLDSCPEGYTASSGVCSLTSSLLLIDIDFSQHLDWTVSVVDTLQTTTGSSLASSTNNPIPTKSQGFYLVAASTMIGISNWVPSPYVTISMWVYPVGQGRIFSLTDGSVETISITYGGTGYIIIAYPLQQGTGYNSYFYNVAFCYTCSGWQLVVGSISQKTSSIVNFELVIDGTSTIISLLDNEARYSPPYYWMLGYPSGWTMLGFIYHLRVYNGIDSTSVFPSSISSILCLPYQYLSGSYCYSCNGSCGTWPWCVDAVSCSPCYDSSCAYCTSFLSSGCFCSNGEMYPCCQAVCTTCSSSGFWVCTTCNTGYNNLASICLGYCASGSCTSLTSTVLIDVLFDAFLGSYSGFVTGADANTYYPFNSPDSDDPIPISNRGLYFAPAMSLNNPSMMLAYTFTIGVWALPTSGNIFTKGSGLVLGSNGSFTIQVFDRSVTAWSYATSTATLNAWSFITITVEFITDTTSITVYINNLQTSYSTYSNQIFIDTSPSTIIIGSSYTGFVYGFKLWNSAVYSFSTEVNDEVCGTATGFTCLLTCNYNEYFTTSCQPCLNTCTSGCVRSTSCNICNSDLCLLCAYFGEPCTSCASPAALFGYALPAVLGTTISLVSV